MSKRQLLLSLLLLTAAVALSFVVYFRSRSSSDSPSMNALPPNPESRQLIADFIHSELTRAKSLLNTNIWDAIMIGVSDQGEIALYPCRLILPFHYPAAEQEAEADSGPDHFDFPDQWKGKYVTIPEFAQQYDLWSAIDEEDHEKSNRIGDAHFARRISVLQDACRDIDPSLTIFGMETDNETWWEVNAFHISGPRLPLPPPQKTDVQLFARLCRQTHLDISNAFTFNNGSLIEVCLDGAATTDSTIDLLRNIPNLRDLLRDLKKLSFRSTLLTSRSLRFLERELPHVQTDYSHFVDDFGKSE